jgi:hypothetical protein
VFYTSIFAGDLLDFILDYRTRSIYYKEGLVKHGFEWPVARMNVFTILTTENMEKIRCVEAHCLVSGKKKISLHQCLRLVQSLAFNVFTRRVVDVMATAIKELYTNYLYTRGNSRTTDCTLIKLNTQSFYRSVAYFSFTRPGKI